MYNSGYRSISEIEHNPADFGVGNCDDVAITDLDCQTILKQRKELQLLICELKDRDHELNDMVSAHQQQLNAWEKDRTKLYNLEKRNSILEIEIKKRNEQIRLLVQRLKISESTHTDKNSVLEATQSKLLAAQKAVDQASFLQRDLQDSNDQMNDSINEMSQQIERLQAKEQDYITQLQLKNGELVEAESELTDLHNKLRRCETELKEVQEQGSKALGDLELQRNKFRQCRADLDKSTAEMATKTNEVIALRQEMSKLRDEVQKLKKELCLSEEQFKRKDDMIQLQKSKQHRADLELTQLRQLYERQQEELVVLQMNLESSQEILTRQEEKLNYFNLNQADLDKLEYSSQTTNDLLEEARKTADDNSFLYTNSNPKTAKFQHKPHSASPHNFFPDENRTHDTNSCSNPTSKLQKLICESKQMVQTLERSDHSPAKTSKYY